MTAILVLEGVVLVGLLTLALDMRAHARVERLGGVNVWGYRGPVLHHREPDEIRIAIVGGTRAFAWGTPASALPSTVRQYIMLTTDQPGAVLRPVVVVSIGRLGAMPDVYPALLERYAYLRPDYVCIYDDLGVRGAEYVAHPSAVFDLTGYRPILPLVLREKGMQWRFGDVRAGYSAAAAATPASISAARRLAGDSFMAVGAALAAIDRTAAMTLGRASDPSAATGDPGAYASSLMQAIDVAHQHARGVVVALSPAEIPSQRERRDALLARLHGRATPAWLRVVDLGGDPTLTRPDVRVDGWNYGSFGVTQVASLIAPALRDLIAAP